MTRPGRQDQDGEAGKPRPGGRGRDGKVRDGKVRDGKVRDGKVRDGEAGMMRLG